MSFKPHRDYTPRRKRAGLKLEALEARDLPSSTSAAAPSGFTVQMQSVPNDPDYSAQWALAAINAPTAWNYSTSTTIIVAVIDTGFAYTNSDLAPNTWHSPTTGQVGYNFVSNNTNPMDQNGHGSIVAGIIGGVGNNGVGVTGVDWSVKMMDLQFMDASGSGSTANAVLAINYAVANGAKILNLSWGGTGYDPSLAAAIANAQAHGVIVVTAAGNSSANNDTTGFYPADMPYNNVVSVAASDQNDNLASFSNYGPNSVDLAAPGVSILSTLPGNTYAYYSGTSMAAPFVSGALALIWGQHPTWNYLQVIDDVLDNVDKVSSLTGKVLTGGVLDLGKAMEAADPANLRVTAVSFTGPSAYSVNSATVIFNIPVNPATVNAGAFLLSGPSGQTISITSATAVAGSNNTQFLLTFATQTSPGTYKLVVEPTITDTTGQKLNQAGAAMGGEPSDSYTATTTVKAAPAPNPALTFSSGTLNKAISANNITYVNLAISNSITITNLTVQLSILESLTSALQIWLEGPTGAWSMLTNERGNGANFTNTIFSDGATTGIWTGMPRSPAPISQNRH